MSGKTLPSYEEALKRLSAPANGPSPEWLKTLRRSAFQRFQELGFPSRTQEAWKHTPLERILTSPFRPLEEKSSVAIDPHAFDKYNLAKDGEYRAVFVNGEYSRPHSLNPKLPPGVLAESLSSVLARDDKILESHLKGRPENEPNAFAAINAFSFQNGFVIFVPAQTEISIPLHLMFAGQGSAEGAPGFSPRFLIVLGEGSKMTLVTSFVSLNREPYFINGLLEIYLGAKSSMHWTMVQRHSQKVCSVLTARCRLEAQSSLERVAFLRGGDVSHHELDILHLGENSEGSAYGLSVLNGQSHVSEILFVKHEASRCRTRQFYKNVLSGQCRAEFNSLVHVGRGTKGADSDQQNRNLVLSKEARAFSRPQLKIDADDVSATHGAATGQLQAQELFYLRSRGFDPALSRFVLAYGFAEEILKKIRPESLRWPLELLVRKEIEAMVG